MRVTLLIRMIPGRPCISVTVHLFLFRSVDYGHAGAELIVPIPHFFSLVLIRPLTFPEILRNYNVTKSRMPVVKVWWEGPNTNTRKRTYTNTIRCSRERAACIFPLQNSLAKLRSTEGSFRTMRFNLDAWVGMKASNATAHARISYYIAAT